MVKVGDIYGNYKVIRKLKEINGRKRFKVLCLLCEKSTMQKLASDLTRKNAAQNCKSCSNRINMTIHGEAETPLFKIWGNMKDRCRKDRNISKYKKILFYSTEWDEFVPFKMWAVKNGWKEGLFVRRINNNKGYSPYNCAISTSSNGRLVNFSNSWMTVREMMAFTGTKLSYSIIKSRLEKGWDIETVLNLPEKSWRNKKTKDLL